LFLGKSWHLLEKTTNDLFFLTQFSQFSKIKILKFIRLLATTLSPLGLTFFNSMLALLVIYFFLFLLDNPLKNENIDFMDFQLNFLRQYQKPQLYVVQEFKGKRIQSLLTLFCRV
jgi:hypothetical protein